jgi:beta-glucosidase
MQMTLREKAEMVIGHLSAMQKVNPMNPDALRELDFTYPGLGMPIGGWPRLGLPVTICSDGSYGLKRYMPMADGKYYTTVFPSPFSNASTWNTHLLQQLSAAYAREGREAGVQVLLGPGMNIMRDPLCGRNFEYTTVKTPCSRVAWEPQWSVAYRAKDWQRLRSILRPIRKRPIA